MHHLRHSVSRLVPPLLVGLAVLLVAGPVAAQEDPDFLFGRPSVRVDLRGGLSVPRAGSQIFDFTSQRLTLNDDDLRSVAVVGAIGYRATERLDVALELGYSSAETTSEFREWQDPDGRPIEQTTRFTRIPLALTLRGYLWDRGRSIGRFAWVPKAWAPYVGAGVGWIGYDFTQEGDFVDDSDPEKGPWIFSDRFHSDGSAPIVHVLAGTEVSLGPRFVMTGEARYAWASAPMGGDFEDFDEIDLSGLQTTLGLSIRF